MMRRAVARRVNEALAGELLNCRIVELLNCEIA